MTVSQVSDLNKYFNDDTVFNDINKNFVSVKEKDRKETNIHLRKVIHELLGMLADQDTFFRSVYHKILFGGSVYKGTKVGFPEEFDLDLVIKLPINYNLVKIEPCKSGFVKIHSGLKPGCLADDQKIHKVLKKLFNDNMYLDQEKFRQWMESILTKTITKLPKRDDWHILNINAEEYKIKWRKSGPAFTLYISMSYYKEISVDLVPVLEFLQKVPNMKYNLEKFKKENWFAVPKPLDKFISDIDKNLYWRTCFYEQEKEILSKNGKIKPVLRQMKKLRDTQNWKHLASYYIESLFLRTLQENMNLESKSCTFLFMIMLEKLHIALQNKCIPYYWNESYNLLSTLKCEEIVNIEGRLKNIINNINRSIQNNPFIIANYVLNTVELHTLKDKQNKILPEILSNEEPLKTGENSTTSRCTIL